MSCCYPEGPQQLEKWDDENLMLFSERNSKTLPWGGTAPAQAGGATTLESSLAEKALGVLMDTRQDMNSTVLLLLRR